MRLPLLVLCAASAACDSGTYSIPAPEASTPIAPEAGSMRPEVISRVVSDHWADLHTCEVQVQARGAHGAIVAQVAVDPTGKVSSVTLASSTAKDPELEACVLDAVRAWSFPPPGHPVVFSHSFLVHQAVEITARVGSQKGVDKAGKALPKALDPSALLAAVNDHQAELRSCHDDPIGDSSWSGPIELDVKLDGMGGTPKETKAQALPLPDGGVPPGGLDPSLQPQARPIADCVKRQASQWRFPPRQPGDTIDVVFTLTFRQGAPPH